MLERELSEQLLGEQDPGVAYQTAMAVVRSLRGGAPVQMIAEISHTVEVRFAAAALSGQITRALTNFGDATGESDRLLEWVATGAERRGVVLVGSGAFPVTALVLARQCPDIAVTCVDSHLPAVALGRAVVEAMAPGVSVEYANGLDVDYGRFDGVIVAAMVSPRNDVAMRALEACRGHVLVRGDVSVQHPRLRCTASGFGDSDVHFR
jgi:hypothetical protein